MSNLATITNNILADSGIDDINVVVTNGSYANPAWITSLDWSKITNSPLGNYLPLVGGTMTGNINWAQTDRGLTWIFNTDGASIKFYNTGDGDVDSRLEFATIDNNNEYFRWVHIPSGGSLYESMRLVPNSIGNAQLIVGGNVGVSAATATAKLQVNNNTFGSANGFASDNSRLGVMLNGSLTSYVYASTYNDPSAPDYGFVFIHGPNTSNYNVWSISPDGPARGSGLHFIYQLNSTNIHNQSPMLSLIGSTSRVGVNTTNPLAQLQVGNGNQVGINGAANKIHIATLGTRSALLTLANSSGGTTVEGQFESSAETADLRVIMGSTSNHDLTIRANNVERVRIAAATGNANFTSDIVAQRYSSGNTNAFVNVAYAVRGIINGNNDTWGVYAVNVTHAPNANNALAVGFATGGTINRGTFTGLSYRGFFQESSMTVSGTGTLATAYGVFINPLNIATNNYSAYFAQNVGIGNPTPSYLLDVSGFGRFRSSRADLILEGTSATEYSRVIFVDSNANERAGVQYINPSFSESGRRQKFEFFGNNGIDLIPDGSFNAPVLALTATGSRFRNNLGVGGAAATYPLTVYNGADGTTAGIGGTAYGLRIDNGGTFSAGMTTLFGVDNTFYGSYQPIRLAGSVVYLGIGHTNNALTIAATGAATFNNTVTAVGIISSSTVRPSSNFAADLGSSGFRWSEIFGFSLNVSSSVTTANLILGNGNNLTWGGAYGANIPTIIGVSGASGFLTFYPSGSTNGEAGRFTNSNNLLLGTTTDNGNRLRVNGKIWADGNVTYWAGFSSYTPDGLFSASADPGRIYTPSGSDRILFGYFDQGGGQYWGRIGFKGSTNWSIGTAAGGHSFVIGVNNGGGGNLVIDNAGAATFSNSVNINASPSSDRMFQVSGTAFTSGAQQFMSVFNATFSGTITNVFGIYAGNNFGTGAITNSYNLYIEGTNAGSATVTNRYGLYQVGSGDRNYFAGNVGINNTNPQNRLTVNTPLRLDGGTNSLGAAVVAGAINSSPSNDFTNSTAIFRIQGTDATNSLQFGVGSEGYNFHPWIQGSFDNSGPSTNAFGVKDILLQPLGGNVGIGATSFAEYGFGSPILKIEGSRATLGLTSSGSLCTIAMVPANNTGLSIHLNQGNDGSFRWYQYSVGQETFTLSGGGNVGIRNANPQAYLDVMGIADQANFSSLVLRAGNSDDSNPESNQILFGYAGTRDYAHAIKTRHQSGGQPGNSIEFWVWKHGDSLSTQAGLRAMVVQGGGVTVTGSVTATAFFESSDSRIKSLLEDKLDYQAISNVNAKYYEKNGKIELGYFAQDFETLLPSAVFKDEEGYLNLSYREVHTAKIAYLEKRINELEQQLKNK